MKTKLDVVKAWNTAAWANPPSSVLEATKTYISDDYKSLDRNGNVIMDKNMMTAMNQMVLAAFKDFKAVFHDLREEADGVVARLHFEGTQTGDLDLSAMGLGVIPASGKKIIWPEATTKFLVEGDQIVGEKEMTAGMEWFLTPLGVKLPAAEARS